MKPAQALTLVRRLAREHRLAVTELPRRGKGSHRIYALADSTGAEVGRFGLMSPSSKDLSWTALGALEEGLAHLFGDKWTEKRR